MRAASCRPWWHLHVEAVWFFLHPRDFTDVDARRHWLVILKLARGGWVDDDLLLARRLHLLLWRRLRDLQRLRIGQALGHLRQAELLLAAHSALVRLLLMRVLILHTHLYRWRSYQGMSIFLF